MERKAWFGLLTLMLITFFANSGIIDANLMESRNLTTAREIVEKGNWLAPTMNGELRFEKPPLPTWLAAISITLFGDDSLFFLRLPSGILASLLVFFLFSLVKDLTNNRKSALLAAATAATSFYIFFMARDVSWDIYCHGFMVGAIWQLHRAVFSQKATKANFVYAGVLMILSFLSKGPIAFYALLLPYLIGAFATYGFAPFRKKIGPLALMSLIVFAISAIWPLYIYINHPEHSTYVAQKESAAWINRNTKPFYHYWSFAAQSGIWTLFAAVALFFPYAKNRIDRVGNYKFIAVWVWASVILLSLFPEKKERYLLPVLIPLAILTAYYIHSLILAFAEGKATRSDIIIVRLNSWLTGLVGLALPVLIWFLIRKNDLTPGTTITVLSVAAFWSTSFFLIRAGIKKKPEDVWRGMVALVALTCLLIFYQIPQIITKNRAFRPYTELRDNPAVKNLPFYGNFSWDGKHLEIVWACGREIKPWDPKQNPLLPTEAPLVLISQSPADSILSKEIVDLVQLEPVGLFDANRQKRWGGSVLKNYVTIIKPK